jgi:hypothetical protein
MMIMIGGYSVAGGLFGSAEVVVLVLVLEDAGQQLVQEQVHFLG